MKTVTHRKRLSPTACVPVPWMFSTPHRGSAGYFDHTGTRLCEPCKHLDDLTQRGVMSGLIHRGGLRAQILSADVSALATPYARNTRNHSLLTFRPGMRITALNIIGRADRVDISRAAEP